MPVGDPIFLTLDEIIAIHNDQLHRYGGAAGILNQAQLESAAAMPSASADGQYLHEDLPEMAAAYLYYLCQAHAFRDGNKRVAAASAIVFLAMNDMEFAAPEMEFADLVEAVARGDATKADVTAFLRKHIRDEVG